MMYTLEQRSNVQSKKIRDLSEELNELARSVGKKCKPLSQVAGNNSILFGKKKFNPNLNSPEEREELDLTLELKEGVSSVDEKVMKEQEALIQRMTNEINELKETIENITNEKKRLVFCQGQEVREQLVRERKANINLKLELDATRKKVAEQVTKIRKAEEIYLEKKDCKGLKTEDVDMLREEISEKSNENDILATEVLNLRERVDELIDNSSKSIALEKANNELTKQIKIEIDKNACLQKELEEMKELRIEKSSLKESVEVSCQKHEENHCSSVIVCGRTCPKPSIEGSDVPHVDSELKVERATNVALSKALSESRGRAAALEQELTLSRGQQGKLKRVCDDLMSKLHDASSKKEETEREVNSLRVRVNELERGARVDDILELQAMSSANNNNSQPGVDHTNSLDGTAQSKFDGTMSDLLSGKDHEIDSLRKEILKLKEEKLDLEVHSTKKYEDLHKLYTTEKEEMKLSMKRQCDNLKKVQCMIKEKEQTLLYMKGEMDRLEKTTDETNRDRREEQEEIQEELLVMQETKSRQEREISVLKSRLEESKLKHQDVERKLKDKILCLEAESPMQRSIQREHDDRMVKDLTNTVQQLKWFNSGLTKENEELKTAVFKLESTRKFSKNDKWRNTQLREENEALRIKIKAMEVSRTNTLFRCQRTQASCKL